MTEEVDCQEATTKRYARSPPKPESFGGHGRGGKPPRPFYVYQGNVQRMVITTARTVREINTKSTGPAFMGGITAKVIFGLLGIIPIYLKTGYASDCFKALRKEL